MSSEQENIQGLLQSSPESAGGEDLSSALGTSQESEFLVAGDEKKPINQQLLYLVLLVLIGGGVMFYMYKRQGPATAAAATAETSKAKQTINSFLKQPDGVKAMESMLKNTEKVVQEFNDYPSAKQVPIGELQTNPFRSQQAAPKPPDANADAEAAARKHEQEKQAALKASQGLTLQTIIHSGSRKACMINNTLYTEGQQVDQFIVETIEKDRVIVRTGAYRFQLTMSH